MYSSIRWRVAVGVAACSAAVLLVAGCSSSSKSDAGSGGGSGSTGGASSSATNAAGTSTGKARSLSDINIAVFYSPTNNAYVDAFNRTADSVSKQLGAKLTVFGSNDVSTQIQQIQSASTSGRYNAWIIAATDPNQECNLILNEAKKIPVLIMNQGLCGNDTYTPGTVSFVGGQTSGVYKQYFDYIAKDNPNGGNAVLLTGPSLNYNTINAEAGFKAMVAANPNIKTVADQQLNYTSATAYDATNSLLRAHPDTTILITNYSDMTVGAVRAIAQLGMTSKVRVYDLGASKAALADVASGGIRMSYPLLPVEEMTKSIQVLADYWQGKPADHVYLDPSQLKSFPGSPFITKANMSDFTPAY